MKSPLFLLTFSIACLLGVACKTDTPNKAITAEGNTSEITRGPIQQDTLTLAQLADIRTIHATFSEVHPISLSEAIENFEENEDTDREIQVWMKMVGTFNGLTNTGNYPRIEQRQEVFSIILASTMMPLEKVKSDLKLIELNEDEVDYIVSTFMDSLK